MKLLFFCCILQIAIRFGTPLGPDDIPHAVSLQLRLTETHICVASIISQFWVLVAAHCLLAPDLSLFPADAFEIITGDGLTYTPNGIIAHPGFNPLFRPDNVALLSVSIQLNSVVQAATVSPNYLSDNKVFQEFSGWNPVRQYTVITISNALCQAKYTPLSPGFISDNDVCYALDGDPTNFLAGSIIASKTEVMALGRGGLPSLPSIYVRLSKYISWIQKTTTS